MDFRAFSEIGKPEHICHKSFLLTVAAGDSQYVLSPVVLTQQKMPEILISVHDKTVVAETAVFSTQGTAVGWFDLAAVCKLTIVKWIVGDTWNRAR